jgi:prevent-host-death family protein
METVTIHKAKTELSKLLKRVEAGEEIMIARGNKTIARIVPETTPVKKERVPGAWKGKFTLPDSFFDPMTEEELADWEGPIEPSS